MSSGLGVRKMRFQFRASSFHVPDSWQPSSRTAVRITAVRRMVFGLTSEVSDRRRQERLSARRTAKWPPGVERRSGAAVRSTDLFAFHFSHRNCSSRRGRRLFNSLPVWADQWV